MINIKNNDTRDRIIDCIEKLSEELSKHPMEIVNLLDFKYKFSDIDYRIISEQILIPE